MCTKFASSVIEDRRSLNEKITITDTALNVLRICLIERHVESTEAARMHFFFLF